MQPLKHCYCSLCKNSVTSVLMIAVHICIFVNLSLPMSKCAVRSLLIKYVGCPTTQTVK